MDPFSSFDLFRRQVDQMFSDFDQQMFGADPFDSRSFLNQQQQPQQQRIDHEKSSHNDMKEKEDEIVVPLNNSRNNKTLDAPLATATSAPSFNNNRSLTTRSAPSSSLGLFQWPSSSGFNMIPSMKLDVMEEKNQYLIHADVPGFNKDQINLQVHDGVLTLRGETSTNNEVNDPERRYHRVERSSGSLYRSLRLPEGIKEDDISATCENGVLKIQVPKLENVEKKKERKIRIA